MQFHKERQDVDSISLISLNEILYGNSDTAIALFSDFPQEKIRPQVQMEFEVFQI
jgi:hypothetical protein